MAVFTQTGVRVSKLSCPSCESSGTVKDSKWQCNRCDASFEFRVLCDVCGKTVKRLKACGGFEEYYCNHCKQPKSKSKVVFEFTSSE